MKKYLILAAVALVAGAACSKVEMNDSSTPGEKITFELASYVPQTKASAAEDEFTSFQAKAYLHAEGINLNGSYAPTEALGFQNFFGTSTAYTETISYHFNDANSNEAKDAGEVTWTPSHDYYWPKSTHSFINFVGWYGKDSAGDATSPTITYAWDTNAYKATLEWDFTMGAVGNVTSNYLYSDMAWRYNSNNNPATNAAVSHVSQGVPMLFHHALAKLCVKAYATSGSTPAITAGSGTVSDGLATWTITLENVSIATVSTAGTLTMTNTDPGSKQTQAWTKSGTGWSSTATGSIAPAANTTIDKVTSGTANTVITQTCVLPQSLAASVVLSGKVRIVTTYADGATNSELIPFSVTLNSMGTTSWEQNTIYTYILKVNPSQSKIYFDPVVEEAWEEEDSITEGTI